MATTTVTTDWFVPYWGVGQSAAWTNGANVRSANATYATAPSSTSAYTAPIGVWAYGFGKSPSMPDPRPGLPAGYSNFTITGCQVRVKGHNNLASKAGGQHISPLSVRLILSDDTTPWTLPRVGPVYLDGADPAASNTNAYYPTVSLLASALNSNANTTGVGRKAPGMTFHPDVWFADVSPNYNLGPIISVAIHNCSATAVGTWNIDVVELRYTYTYDTPDPVVPSQGGSRGARLFFDYV